MYLFRNVRHCFQTILKEEGGFWRGCLYRGLSPTLMVIMFDDDVIANDIISNSLLLQGIAPYVGLNFAVYETLKGKEYWYGVPSFFTTCVLLSVHFLSHSQDTQLSVPLRLGCGAVAGATAQSSKLLYT